MFEPLEPLRIDQEIEASIEVLAAQYGINKEDLLTMIIAFGKFTVLTQHLCNIN